MNRYYPSDVRLYSGYYPGGMQMPNRNGGVNEYRYQSINGMEQDDEVAGKGNSYTTQFRSYDSRLGRWLSIDPVTHPQYILYSVFDNNPIYFEDPKGSNSKSPDESAVSPPEYDGNANLESGSRTLTLNYKPLIDSDGRTVTVVFGVVDSDGELTLSTIQIKSINSTEEVTFTIPFESWKRRKCIGQKEWRL